MGCQPKACLDFSHVRGLLRVAKINLWESSSIAQLCFVVCVRLAPTAWVGEGLFRGWGRRQSPLSRWRTTAFSARPTGLGARAASALLGARAAMACTVAVESVITEHYDNQIRQLLADPGGPAEHGELLEVVRRCRDDEQAHHDTGLEQGAEGAPLYGLLTTVITAGCRGAIWLAERL
ncbi:hypothetical protein HPB48_027143 [Haemaphysalis longicornis]|uniref:Uncharacterized protein n=1 Tax=Haemaphysalis longicornis TaxID=44386 RepID=A0A9J6H373_HAELO|nr:hypothetical protein HPB48_027143 [Haemaphysalis longicornis]